jgi:hypothetical protein
MLLDLLSEAESHRIWDVVPPGNPYGSLDAMLAAEIGTTADRARKRVQELRSLEPPGANRYTSSLDFRHFGGGGAMS